MATLTWAGTSSGSQNVGTNLAIVPFAGPGVWTLTVDTTIIFNFTGIGAGGGGGTSGGSDGGGGGGSAVATSGTLVTLVPSKTYTLTLTAGVGAAVTGGDTTFTNTTDSSNLVTLKGGHGGFGKTAGVGSSTGSSTGSNLVAGTNGGIGATLDVPGSAVAGGTQTNGAGGGGGGGDADATSNGQSGGNGKDQVGGAGTGAGGRGGPGGGMSFNSVFCGFGGFGGGGAISGTGGTSGPGGGGLTVSSVPIFGNMLLMF